MISAVRVSHDCADLDEIEAARVDDRRTAVETLLDQPGVDEAFVLQTCHRIEAYVVASDADAGTRALSTLPAGRAPAGVSTGHEASLRHLLRVAAGLESIVLGEDQVLGQVRDARDDARAVDGLGPVLEEAVTKALHVGERARTETGINEGIVSLGSAAVALAERERDLAGRSALVVGAGEMGELAARAFARSDVDRVAVANRTPERAADLAAELPCASAATGLDDLADAVTDADVVVAATGSSEPILDVGTFDAAGGALVVDLGQPRDLSTAAADREDVRAFDIDDLEAVTGATRERRREAATEVETMVDDELDRLLDQYKRERADEVIGAMYESADRLKDREVHTAVSRLEAAGDLTDEQREIVESLADSLVSRLLAAPTRSLRDAAGEDDWETIHTALRLFDPEFEDGPPTGVASGAAAPSDVAPADVVDDD